jgi:hypothetical protein
MGRIYGVTGSFAVCSNACEGCSLANAIRCGVGRIGRVRFREVKILALESAGPIERYLLDGGGVRDAH